MHLILTGASGLVGSATLHAMQRNTSITQISILSRRAVPQATTGPAASKCTVHIQPDFSVPPPKEVLEQLKGAHGCVWALGISSNAVGKDEYKQITVDYALIAAKAFAENEGAGHADGKGIFNFVYVSGEGATQTPGMLTPMFGKVKGEAETALLELSKEEKYKDRFRVYAARAGAVDPKGHKEVEEAQKTRQMSLLKKMEDPIRAVIRPIMRNLMSPTFHLGEALVMLASGDGKPLEGAGVEGEGRIVRNTGLRRIAGL